MQREFHLVKILFLLVLYIGINPHVLNAEVIEPDLETLIREHKVFVEPTNLVTEKVDQKFGVEPYQDRRHRWGYMVGASYSGYEPFSFEPSSGGIFYRDVYKKPAIGLIELKVTIKRNFAMGSLGFEVSGGVLRNDNSDPGYVNSVLRMNPVSVGAAYYLDTLSPEPLFVPYVAAGAYEMFFKDSLGAGSDSGNTNAAAYVNAGVALQLDWIDPRAARKGFEDSGTQNSFVFLEGRKYFASANETDPNFSAVTWATGVRVEF